MPSLIKIVFWALGTVSVASAVATGTIIRTQQNSRTIKGVAGEIAEWGENYGGCKIHIVDDQDNSKSYSMSDSKWQEPENKDKLESLKKELQLEENWSKSKYLDKCIGEKTRRESKNYIDIVLKFKEEPKGQWKLVENK